MWPQAGPRPEDPDTSDGYKGWHLVLSRDQAILKALGVSWLVPICRGMGPEIKRREDGLLTSLLPLQFGQWLHVSASPRATVNPLVWENIPSASPQTWGNSTLLHPLLLPQPYSYCFRLPFHQSFLPWVCYVPPGGSLDDRTDVNSVNDAAAPYWEGHLPQVHHWNSHQDIVLCLQQRHNLTSFSYTH